MILNYLVFGLIPRGAEFHPLLVAAVSVETWQMQYSSSIWYTIT